MNRPRLFLSAVSEELRSARQSVAATVNTLGYDSVSQDAFPTGHGELRDWLRQQIDSCEGLIQIVGQGYGAEPPDVDPAFGRVSYTQFEFLYARKRGKMTWLILAGDGCQRDKPIDALDLPREPGCADPVAYQAERRKRQQEYVAQLQRDNHLWHPAASPAELQNVVLRLRDELRLLRRHWERQQRRLATGVAASLIMLLVLSVGGWLGYRSLQRGVAEVSVVTTEKIRAHLLQTVDETHRREVAQADKAADWRERQKLREAADAADAARRARINELAESFAQIEGRGASTTVFQEMTRILASQGVDQAIAYVDGQRSSILETVRARARAAGQQNRADLEPLLQTAALYESKGQTAEARSLYHDILAAEPAWPAALHACFLFLINQGDIARKHTTLSDALRDYEEAQQLAQRLTAGDPDNTEWQRDLSISYERLGIVAVAQGKLDEAAQNYGDSLAIAKKLTANDPGNTEWQRDLSVSYNKVGDVAVAQGNLDEAARNYGDSLAIRKKLAAIDPSNTRWQRDLSVSYNKVGDVAVAQGNLDEAARNYGDSLAIRKKLAASDPGNTQWQRDLSACYSYVGDVAVTQGKLDEAARNYGDGLAISKTLAASDPGNTQWQRGLSIAYEKVGDVAVTQGNLDEAAQNYGDSLAIAKKLAASDPGNAAWQRDVWISFTKLANLAERQEEPGQAREYWKQALDVLSEMEKRSLHLSPEDRGFLAQLRQKIAEKP